MAQARLNVTGTLPIYSRDWVNKKGEVIPLHSTSIPSINSSGHIVKTYLTIKFRDGLDLPVNNSLIKVTDGVFTPYISAKKTAYFLMVNEYELLESGDSEKAMQKKQKKDLEQEWKFL